jgi:hypothetical protein
MHAPVVGVKKIGPVRNKVGVRGPNRALGPPHRGGGWRTAVLPDLNRQLDRVLHLVLHPRGSCGNQPTLPCLFI